LQARSQTGNFIPEVAFRAMAEAPSHVPGTLSHSSLNQIEHDDRYRPVLAH
jgi:hypothetical protein